MSVLKKRVTKCQSKTSGPTSITAATNPSTGNGHATAIAPMEAIARANDSGSSKAVTNASTEAAGDVRGGKLEKAIAESSRGGKGATTTS